MRLPPEPDPTPELELSDELKEKLGKDGIETMKTLHGIATCKTCIYQGMTVTTKDKLAAIDMLLNRKLGKPQTTAVIDVTTHEQNLTDEDLVKEISLLRERLGDKARHIDIDIPKPKALTGAQEIGFRKEIKEHTIQYKKDAMKLEKKLNERKEV